MAVADLALVKPAQAHVHEFLELAFVTAGLAIHSEAGTSVLHRGHVVVMAAGGWHAYQPDLEMHVVNIRVGVEVLRELLPWLGTLPGLGYLFEVEHSSPLFSTAVASIDSNQARTIRPAVRAFAEPPIATDGHLFSRLARRRGRASATEPFQHSRHGPRASGGSRAVAASGG